MIDDTIQRIETRIAEASNLADERKQELTGLLHRLRGELDELAEELAEQSASITGFVDLSTHEATRSEQDPRLLQHAVDGLTDSVETFEASHPRLVQTVNAIANLLSGMGI